MPRQRHGSPTPHLKSMGTYELHAHRDAMAIAFLMDDLVGAEPARKLYARMDVASLKRYERKMEEQIADFIGRSESQRPSVIRKLPDDTTRVGFMTLAILGCVRAGHVLEIRDRYRDTLAPGRGNRQTVQAMYEFSLQVMDTFSYAWPSDVFENAGLTDGWQEDEVADHEAQSSTEDAAQPLRPTVPLRPRAASPVQLEQIHVSMGLVENVLARAGSDEKAWALTFVSPQAGNATVNLSPTPPNDDVLLSALLPFGQHVVGRPPAYLVMSSRHKALVEKLNERAGREIAVATRKGICSMAFAKWPGEILRALERELQLVGEPMLSAGEFLQLLKRADAETVLTTGHADEKNSWWQQREDLEKWTKAILAERGRWVGPTTGQRTRPSHDYVPTRDLGKTRRTVRKLMDDVDLTPLGDALLAIGSAAMRWRDQEMAFDDAARAAASDALEYHFRRPAHGEHNLGLQLLDMLGRGSAEMAMLDAGFTRLLAGPFLAGIDTPEQERQHTRMGAMHRHITSSRYWYWAWWCVVELPAPEDLPQAKWLLTQAALDRVASHAVGASDGTLRVGTEPFPLQLAPRNTAAAWNSDTSGAYGSAMALVDWILRRTPNFRSYGRWEMREGGVRWGFPVLARAESVTAVVAVRSAWERSAA